MFAVAETVVLLAAVADDSGWERSFFSMCGLRKRTREKREAHIDTFGSNRFG